MFGDESKLTSRQQSSNECNNSFPILITPTDKLINPLTQDKQTASQFEGEHESPLSEEALSTEQPSSKEDISNNQTLSDTMNLDPLSPEITPAFTPSTESVSPAPNDVCLPEPSTPSIDSMPIYEEPQTLSPPAQKQRQLTYHESDEGTSNIEIIPFTLDESHRVVYVIVLNLIRNTS